MSADNFASLLYLGLLLVAIGGYFFVSNRHRLGQVAQQAAVWALIFVGVTAAFGLWSDIRKTVPSQYSISSKTGEISVPRSPDGHYYLTINLNDTPVRFVVDTGATEIVLSTEDATRIGLDPTGLPFLGRANTANGTVQTAKVRIEKMALGNIVDRNVQAHVNGGAMAGSLLGMGYLQRFSTLKIEDNRLTLIR